VGDYPEDYQTLIDPSLPFAVVLELEEVGLVKGDQR
jgi:hypothetical protein